MAIGAFMACLCVTPAYITVGNVLLIVSIVVMVYGYSVWQGSITRKYAPGPFGSRGVRADRCYSLLLASM